MILKSTLDEKTISTIKSGQEMTILLKSNGRRVSKTILVKVIKEVKVKKCSGCSIILGNKPTKVINNQEFCLDCSERH